MFPFLFIILCAFPVAFLFVAEDISRHIDEVRAAQTRKEAAAYILMIAADALAVASLIVLLIPPLTGRCLWCTTAGIFIAIAAVVVYIAYEIIKPKQNTEQ